MGQPARASFFTAARGGIVVFCLVVLTLGWISFREYAHTYRTDARERLATIADLKAREIAGWRRERLADGQFYIGNLTVIDLAERIFRPGGDAVATTTLRDLLSRMQRNHQYHRIALHDAGGVERVASPADGEADDGHMRELVRSAAEGGESAFLVLHANEGEQPFMSVVAPLKAGLGAVVIRIDAVTALAGLVRTWPVPAETAETLIVRRDGNEVVYLNAILGAPEAASMPPVPMTRTDLPAVQAVLTGRTTIDATNRLEQMKKMLERLIGEDIRLTFDLERDLWRVRADPGQLEQVIMNLAVNARDAMPDGGTLVVTTRNVTDDASGAQWVTLAVADTGCGMDEATQQRLFEPFFTTKRAGQGTGLGLATVYGIVTQSGGRVDVSSAVNHGSTFRVHLPKITDDAAAGVTMPRPERIIRGTARILIVEDEESLRRMAERILQAAGYTTVSACDGPQAIALLGADAAPIDLLLTDVVMPGMNGHELASRITATHPDLKVLFTSGYLHDAFPDRARLGPEVHFLAKPYSPSTLTSKVRDVLDRT